MGPEVRDFFSRAKVDEDPSLLQQITRDQFNHGTLTVGGEDGTVHGVPVFPVPLFEVLDGQDQQTTSSASSLPIQEAPRLRQLSSRS